MVNTDCLGGGAVKKRRTGALPGLVQVLLVSQREKISRTERKELDRIWPQTGHRQGCLRERGGWQGGRDSERSWESKGI